MDHEHSNERSNVFVFRPVALTKFPDDYFIEGELVELIVPV